MIHRCLLARSVEQFSWVKIVVLHSGKGAETKKRRNNKNKNNTLRATKTWRGKSKRKSPGQLSTNQIKREKKKKEEPA